MNSRIPSNPRRRRAATSALAALSCAAAATVLSAAPAQAATVDRIGGTDRIDTAIKIFEGNRDVFTVNGAVLARSDVYADALAATPQAAGLRAPILTNPSGSLDSRVLAALKRQNITNVGIVGGPAAISSGVETALKNAGIRTARVGGTDRYDTALQIAAQTMAFKRQTSTKVFLATGTNFADALAAGPAAHTEGAVILLSQGSRLDSATAAFLKSSKTNGVVAVGGPAVAAARAAGVRATEVNGTDRYDTAAKLAPRVNATPALAVLASGETFADALPGGVLAGLRKAPLLLTQRSLLSPQTAAYLTQHKPNVLILGGENAVYASVARAVAAAIATTGTNPPPPATGAAAAELYGTARTTASSASNVQVSGTLTARGLPATVSAQQVGGASGYQHFTLQVAGSTAEMLRVGGQYYVKADAALWELGAGVTAAKAAEVAGKWVTGTAAQVASLTGLPESQLTVSGLISARLLPTAGPLGASLTSGTVTTTTDSRTINAADGAKVTVSTDAAASPSRVVGPTTNAGDVTLTYTAATQLAAPTSPLSWPV